MFVAELCLNGVCGSASSPVSTVVQSSAEVEHELLSLSSDSWTDAQQPNPCTPTVIQGFAEHVCLPSDDPIEDFSEEDMATGSMAEAGRSPNKHPRTGSEDDGVDIAALLDRAADRFSACMDTKVDSMVVLLDRAVPLASLLQYLLLLTWKSRSGADFETDTHGLTEAQAREIITKLRQGIGPDLDSLIARVGAVRVRNTKIILYLKTPSLSSCKQIQEAMNAFIEKENIKLGPQGTTPFVTEEKPAWRQEQQRTFGKALGVAEQLATMKAKYITSEWYPFYQVYVHESESAQPIPLFNDNIWSSGGNN